MTKSRLKIEDYRIGRIGWIGRIGRRVTDAGRRTTESVIINQRFRSLRSLLFAFGVIFLLSGAAFAAEITANKMTILNTEQGKVTMFEDGVSITDGGTHIGAGKVEFYDQQNLAVIHGGNVTITTPNASVTAESAQYLIGIRRTYLYRNVVIRQAGFRLASPSVVLENGSDQVMADNGVDIVDADRGIEITGRACNFNLTSQDGTVSGAPRLKVNRSGGMIVTSDELQLRQTQHEAQAIGHVLVQTNDVVLTCDTMWYYLDQDSARASGSPIMKQKENTVSGDLMRFRFEKDDLKRIDVTGERNQPTLTQKHAGKMQEMQDSADEDRISGREIAIEFVQGKLAEIVIEGDSARQPEIRQQANRAAGDRITFQFREGEIEQVKLSGASFGTYFTDAGDRIEISGSESVLHFKNGDAVQVEVADVKDGKLFRHAEVKKPPADLREH